MFRFLFNARALAALALAVIVCGLAANGAVIILKDGYTIHGIELRKEKAVVIDEVAGAVFLFDDPKGMTAVDDGPRWVIFPNTATQVADVSENNRFKDFAAYTRDFYRGTEKLPSTARNPEKGDWDVKEWTRIIKFNDEDARVKHTVKQHINLITPHYVRVGSSSHTIVRFFLLKEFKPDFIRSLLVHHPDLVEKSNKPDPERRERLIRFWIQAEWLDEADKDLDELLKALPAEKERFARLKSEVNILRAEKLMVEIERAREAGRHQAAIKALEAFPKQDVPRAVSLKVTTSLAEYDGRTAKFNSARRLLDELPKRVKADANQFLTEAAAAVRNEVHLDTLPRLDMFLTLAERAEKDAKDGRRPAHSPEELIAAAVSGWHLGKVAAETKPGFAYKCWMTRLMALDYLRNPQRGGREAMLKQYLGRPYALGYDEIEKLISLLPPPEAPASPAQTTTTVTLTPSVAFPNGVTFALRLPDEYQPGRSYPVLILLADPSMDRTPDAILAEFGDLAARHGYILAAPQWWDPIKTTYNYSREEQGTVTLLLRHLRRAYQIDSDRVFLCGNGEGASLAMDYGAGHPDLFAGIVPVNPSIRSMLFIRSEYWVNFEKLPVYMIMGDKFGPSVSTIRMLCERWMPRGFSTLVVSYKGRGQEWFSEELPYVFDWMGRKRRADPGKMVGPPRFEGKTVAAGFSSVRRTDNRFHWLSSDDIKPERTMQPNRTTDPPTPAKFSARILEGNTIDVKVFGARDLTVWFGKGMLDYSKPVTIKVPNVQKPVTKKITPSIEVLMEDLYDRGDRQRPYFEKVELKMP